jgi:hemoglobin-like flavoprotein
MHQVEQSLEIAAERCPDLGPLVYGRLFALHPELEAMFVLDTDGSVRGSMLSHSLRVLLDLIDERHFGPSFIKAECIRHGYSDLPPEMFVAFYPIVRDAVHEVVGPQWTDAMQSAWEDVLREIAELIERPVAGNS